MEKTRYIIRDYKKEITHDELDLINQDAILGENIDGHEYENISKNRDKFDYTGESIEIDINLAIDTLKELKEAGSNYVEIMYHCDHVGYVFTGVDMRLATDEEIKEHQKKYKIERNEFLNSKIEVLENEISKIKKQIK